MLYVITLFYALYGTHLSGQLWQEVLISREGPEIVQVANSWGQRLQFITATVKLF